MVRMDVDPTPVNQPLQCQVTVVVDSLVRRLALLYPVGYLIETSRLQLLPPPVRLLPLQPPQLVVVVVDRPTQFPVVVM
jgi:hypothetical protein